MSELVQNDRQRQMLMDELQHRSRNSFQIIQAIIQNSIQNAEDAEVAIGRVRALSLTNQLLTTSQGQPVRLQEMIENELRPHGHPGATVAECDIRVEGDIARCLALVLHELATNAVKHGAFRKKSGTLNVRCERIGEVIRIKWTETNDDRIIVPEHHGFGSKLVVGMLRQVGGKVDAEFRPTGLVCEITVPDNRALGVKDICP
jgi:two-component sensor histidine kinase